MRSLVRESGVVRQMVKSCTSQMTEVDLGEFGLYKNARFAINLSGLWIVK